MCRGVGSSVPPFHPSRGKNTLSFVGSVTNSSERKFYWTFIPSLAGSPAPTPRVLEFRLESIQSPVGAGCSRALGVYRCISAGTCDAKHTCSRAHLANAGRPGDRAVRARAGSRRPSSRPAASAYRHSGSGGWREGNAFGLGHGAHHRPLPTSEASHCLCVFLPRGVNGQDNPNRKPDGHLNVHVQGSPSWLRGPGTSGRDKEEPWRSEGREEQQTRKRCERTRREGGHLESPGEGGWVGTGCLGSPGSLGNATAGANTLPGPPRRRPRRSGDPAWGTVGSGPHVGAALAAAAAGTRAAGRGGGCWRRGSGGTAPAVWSPTEHLHDPPLEKRNNKK